MNFIIHCCLRSLFLIVDRLLNSPLLHIYDYYDNDPIAYNPIATIVLLQLFVVDPLIPIKILKNCWIQFNSVPRKSVNKRKTSAFEWSNHLRNVSQ